MSTGMAATDPERACYICLGEEGDFLDDVCACNSAVHAACLARWVRESGQTRCTVCARPLRFVVAAPRLPTAANVLCRVVAAVLVCFPIYLTTALLFHLVRAQHVLPLMVASALWTYEWVVFWSILADADEWREIREAGVLDSDVI